MRVAPLMIRGGEKVIRGKIADTSDLHHRMVGNYLEYNHDTESPNIYHRWTLLSIIGALVGRNCWLRANRGKLYPNQYILLVGDPGARKGTAISTGKKLLKEIGYKMFAPDKVAKEAMWYAMAKNAGQLGEEWEGKGEMEKDENLLEIGFEGGEGGLEDSIAEMYVCRDEFTAFTGHGNHEFIDSLTNLWDNLPVFDNPKLTSRDVKVYNPTLNILSGSTPENIATALPQQVIGSGFFSRLLLIYGEHSKDVAWASEGCERLRGELLEDLVKIEGMRGEIGISDDALQMVKECYSPGRSIVSDSRLASYGPRRQTHLLKLCTVYAISRHSHTITSQDFLLANTTLYLAEKYMPLALGHFGRNRNSASANAVLGEIYRAHEPITFRELWIKVATDFGKQEELKDVLKNLKSSEKIQEVAIDTGGRRKVRCFIPKKGAAEEERIVGYIDQELVTEEERIM